LFVVAENKKTVPPFPLNYTMTAVIALRAHTGVWNRYIMGHKKSPLLQADYPPSCL
jgi:hypothetical protein